MQQKKSWLKFIVAGVTSALLLSNCVTSYDRQGRPIQTVDPAAAAIGAAAIGVIAYSAGKNNSSHHHGHYGYHRSYHGYRGCHR